MRITLLLIGFLCFFESLYSQEFYFYTGKNFSNYDFKSSANNSGLLQSGIGDSYEMGYSVPLENDKFSYAVGLGLNEYNAVGSDSANSFSWNTQYLSVQNRISYLILLSNKFNLGLNGGLGLATLIYGKQEVNGTYYNLSSQKEFSGLFIQPGLGLETQYKMYWNGYLSLGYTFSKSVNLTNTTDEKLGFNTHQIQFGLHFETN